MSGGISDCRNHRIQDMFRYIGLGDHAGSGIPSILKSWKSQHWRMPLLHEDRVHEQTLLELRTSSLLPEESIRNLQKTFGERFNNLSELQRIALVTAETEGLISHTRLKSLCIEHPKDISTVLTGLVKDGFLERQGETRAAIYYIKGTQPQRLFTQESMPDSPDLNLNSPDLSPSFPDLTAVLSNALRQLGYSAMPGKLTADKMKILITTVCTNRWLTLQELSRLLKREPKSLQEQYLTPMVADGSVQLRFPESRNHPGQAYGVFSE